MIDLDLLLMNGPTLAEGFALNLRAEMVRQELTPTKLAAITGIKVNLIGSWLSGPAVPSGRDLIRLCLDLGVTPEALLGWSRILHLAQRSRTQPLAAPFRAPSSGG